MSSNRDATIGRYTGVEQANSVADLTTEIPPEVGESISDIDRFQAVVMINDNRGPFVVGGVDTDQAGANRLYDADTATFAGWLLCSRDVNFSDRGESESAYSAGFKPTGQESAETVYAVESFELSPYGQMERLQQLLPHLRTELTGEDWVTDGRAKTSYPQWGQAIVELMDFYKSDATMPNQMDCDLLGHAQIEHAVARYPTPAVDVAARAENVCQELEGGLSTATPVGFINFLVAYADDNVGVENPA